MRKIILKDILPPITFNMINYVKKKISKLKNEEVLISPFDAMPNNLNVKWILDIGANIGNVAIAGLNSYPNAKVMCFEPVKSTFAVLKKNMKPYASRCFLYNVALSDVEESGYINITTAHGANSIKPQAEYHKELNPHVRFLEKQEISMVKLDDFQIKLPSIKIDIMKIDVEGFELNVLKGGEKFITSNVDIIIIEICFMRDESLKNQAIFEIFDSLHGMGFCLINIFDLHYAENHELKIAQMDCVFQNTRNHI